MALTKVKLHGNLVKKVGQKEWELEVDSVAEAMHAIDIMSNKKLSIAILDNEKQKAKYKIIVNGKNLLSKNINTPEEAIKSELCIKKSMETIDIVPVLEGAGGGGGDDGKDIAMVVGGALMIGAFWGTSPLMVQLGLYAVITGMANLLSEPPEFEDFREMQDVNKRESYLFNGPVNTYNPGGPIPVGYGRMLVGSLSVSFSQDNTDKKIYDNGTFYP